MIGAQSQRLRPARFQQLRETIAAFAPASGRRLRSKVRRFGPPYPYRLIPVAGAFSLSARTRKNSTPSGTSCGGLAVMLS